MSHFARFDSQKTLQPELRATVEGMTPQRFETVRDIPLTDDDELLRRLTGLLGEVARIVEASSIVTIFERPGSDQLGPDDMRWFRRIQSSTRAAHVPLRAHLLCHGHGVRLVHPDEVSVDFRG
jgi:hypothetical protein